MPSCPPRALLKARFAQNVPRLAKEIPKDMMPVAPGVWPSNLQEFDLLANFAEFQQTRAGGPLGKFDIARLHGHFGANAAKCCARLALKEI